MSSLQSGRDNSVISNMLIYIFHVYLWPIILLKKLTQMIKNFIWSGDINQQKICTASWKVVCKPIEEGGLAIKDPFFGESSFFFSSLLEASHF